MALTGNEPVSPGVTTRRLRIGIVGAGLVGSCASIVFSRLHNVQVETFEKSPVAREAGAWISLSVSGLRILNELMPSAEINAIAYRPPDKAVYVTRHWKTGEDIVRRYSSSGLKDSHIQARTHREPLLKLLLRHVPEGTIEYGHRVTKLSVGGEIGDTGDGAVRVDFADHSARHFDLVVAADGIYSPTRKAFLPDHRVCFKGKVAYRCIFPKARVAGIPGLHDDSSVWCKDGEVVFLSELGLDMYGVVIIKGESGDYASKLGWERSISSEALERLRQRYQDWDPVVQRVLSVINDIQAYPLESGPWLQDLTREGCVAFIGDAAHPTAGAYGMGAAMGFGDAWALCRSLEATRTTPSGKNTHAYDVARALRIFNATRSPFLARVERQMTLDRENATYVAAASNEEEWIKRFRERNPASLWMSEHDAELEVQKMIMGEPLGTENR